MTQRSLIARMHTAATICPTQAHPPPMLLCNWMPNSCTQPRTALLLCTTCVTTNLHIHHPVPLHQALELQGQHPILHMTSKMQNFLL